MMQDQCLQPMRDLGYKMAVSPEMLKNYSESLYMDYNDLSSSWIGPLLLSRKSRD